MHEQGPYAPEAVTQAVSEAARAIGVRVAKRSRDEEPEGDRDQRTSPDHKRQAAEDEVEDDVDGEVDELIKELFADRSLPKGVREKIGKTQRNLMKKRAKGQ